MKSLQAQSVYQKAMRASVATLLGRHCTWTDRVDRISNNWLSLAVAPANTQEPETLNYPELDRIIEELEGVEDD
jgi:hypothetical protein